MSKRERILFIAASGIGNTILATPLMEAVRIARPDAKLELLTSRKNFQAPLLHGDRINAFYDLEKNPFGVLIQLRGRKYDYSFNCFPSIKWQFNVVARIIGAKRRVTHQYPMGNRFPSFMHHLSHASETQHDIEQNLALISGLDPSYPFSEKVLGPFFDLNEDDHAKAETWLAEHGCTGKKLVGVHLGGGDKQSGAKEALMNQPLGAGKIPPVEKVTEDLKLQCPDDNSAILMFGSGAELELLRNFQKELPDALRERTLLVETGLWTVAAIISRCAYFISGDTGLMHIAACFGIEQKAYFMATNPLRTAPRNEKVKLVIAPGCNTYKYPFSTAQAKLEKS